MLGAEVGDVVALDPDRQLLHRQRLAQVGERVDPALAAVLATEAVLVEGEAGVALGELAQPPLVAALGDPDLDRRPALLAERGGEQLGPVGEVGPDDDRPRDRRRGRVVLAEELLGDLGGLAFGLVVEVEALALGEDPVADLEDLGVGVGPLGRRPRSGRRCRPSRRRSAGARTGTGSPSGGRGGPPPARIPATPRRNPSSPPRPPRPGGSDRRGRRRSRRCCDGTHRC